MLTDLAQLDEMVAESTEKPVVVFKHSTRCGVSRMVLKQFENEFDLHDEITPYFLDLLAHRTISNEIAKRFDVFHQSPQLIVIKDGKIKISDKIFIHGREVGKIKAIVDPNGANLKVSLCGTAVEVLG